MLVKFAEVIRTWAGWCPNRAVSAPPVNAGRYAVQTSPAAPRSDTHVVGGLLVDYGGICIPIPLVITLTAGFIVLVLYLSVTYPPAGGLLFIALCLACSGMELYRTLRRDLIEETKDAITIRRSLFPPVVIPKDSVVKAEVRKSALPIPWWLFVAAVAVILASSVGSIYGGLDNPASFQVVCGFGAAVFFPAMFYRTCVRTRYPRVLTLTTAKKKIVMIYADDPDSIAGILEVS